MRGAFVMDEEIYEAFEDDLATFEENAVAQDLALEQLELNAEEER